MTIKNKIETTEISKLPFEAVPESVFTNNPIFDVLANADAAAKVTKNFFDAANAWAKSNTNSADISETLPIIQKYVDTCEHQLQNLVNLHWNM